MSEQRTSDLIARAFEIRSEIKELETAKKELNKELNDIKLILLARADEQGATRIATDLGTAIVSEQIVPQIDDWDAAQAYIKENDFWHLLPRKINSAAFRELQQAGTDVPGVSPYMKRDINLRPSK